jgi:AcrR family transcriptional regulator
VGSFYARFQGKDDLLRFLGEGALEDSLESWTTRGDHVGEPARTSSEIDNSLDALLGLFLEGPGRTLALLEGVQDPPPSRRRRLETAVTEEISDLTGLDPQRAGVRVRALVGLLQDAARRSVLGEAGEVEYGFLPEGAVLREEGLSLLMGKTSVGRSEAEHVRQPLPHREEPPESERATATVEVEVPTVEKPAAKVATIPLEIAASHSRPAAEPESQTSEPDPFVVWG